METGKSLEEWLSGSQPVQPQPGPPLRPRSRRASAFDQASQAVAAGQAADISAGWTPPESSAATYTPPQPAIPANQRYVFDPAPLQPRDMATTRPPRSSRHGERRWRKPIASIGVVAVLSGAAYGWIAKPWQHDSDDKSAQKGLIAGAKPFTDYTPRALGCTVAATINANIDIPTAWKFTLPGDAAKTPHTLRPDIAPLHIETASGPATLQVCISDPKLIVPEAATAAATGSSSTANTTVSPVTTDTTTQAFQIDASKIVLKIDPINIAINARPPQTGIIAVEGVPLSGGDQATILADVQTKSTTAGPAAYSTLDKLLDSKNRDGQNGYVTLINNAIQKAFQKSEQQQAIENKQTFDPNNAPILKIQGMLPTIEASYLATLKDGKLPDIASTAILDTSRVAVTQLSITAPKESNQ